MDTELLEIIKDHKEKVSELFTQNKGAVTMPADVGQALMQLKMESVSVLLQLELAQVRIALLERTLSDDQKEAYRSNLTESLQLLRDKKSAELSKQAAKTKKASLILPPTPTPKVLA